MRVCGVVRSVWYGAQCLLLSVSVLVSVSVAGTAVGAAGCQGWIGSFEVALCRLSAMRRCHRPAYPYRGCARTVCRPAALLACLLALLVARFAALSWLLVAFPMPPTEPLLLGRFSIVSRTPLLSSYLIPIASTRPYRYPLPALTLHPVDICLGAAAPLADSVIVCKCDSDTDQSKRY